MKGTVAERGQRKSPLGEEDYGEYRERKAKGNHNVALFGPLQNQGKEIQTSFDNVHSHTKGSIKHRLENLCLERHEETRNAEDSISGTGEGKFTETSCLTLTNQVSRNSSGKMKGNHSARKRIHAVHVNCQINIAEIPPQKKRNMKKLLLSAQWKEMCDLRYCV